VVRVFHCLGRRHHRHRLPPHESAVDARTAERLVPEGREQPRFRFPKSLMDIEARILVYRAWASTGWSDE
jgi:hypothetical protein